MGLQLELLGPPRATVDGAPLQVDTRKALAILAVVAVEGPQSRGQLAALLWPDSETARARGALRRTLSVLSRGLGDRWLQIDGDRVALTTDDVQVDAREAAALLDRVRSHLADDEDPCDRCLVDLRRAVALHRGEFLEGFGLRDSPEFDDWRTAQAEMHRRQRCRSLDLLSHTTLQLGQLQGTIDSLESWLAIDPLNEDVHARLMLVHAWRGERAEAIRRYRACVAVLDAELGVAPLPKTTQLYRAILEDRIARTDQAPHLEAAEALSDPPERSAGTSTSPPAGTADAWPVVGRDELLDDLVEQHRSAGSGTVIVLTGEAGVGKSRTAEALRQRVGANGSRTGATRCYPGESGLAFGPVVDLLRQASSVISSTEELGVGSRTLAEVRRLAPSLFGHEPGPPDLPPLDSPGARAVLFEAVWDVLEASFSREIRGLLVLDELQVVDPSTLELLRYGLHRLTDRALTVVLCLRTEDAPQEVLQLLEDPSLEGIRRAVELPRLPQEATLQLVDVVLGADDAAVVTARLHEEAEGLPLLLVEYLRLIVDGEVDPQRSGWALPRGAVDLARSRMTGLTETARQVASTAAAIGRSFDLEVTGHASGRSDNELVEGIEELLQRRLVREVPDPSGDLRYDFVHDKLRTAIYGSTSLARRRLLHGRIADALASGHRGKRDAGPLAAVIAEHARLAGREADAATWFSRAGEHARSLYANAEALGHLEQALALGDPETFRLRAAIAELHILLGQYVTALEALEAAAAVAEGPQEMAWTEHQLGTVHLRRGELEPARAHLEAARGLLGEEATPLAARVEADLGLLQLRNDELEAASGHADRANELAEGLADAEAQAQALNLLGVIARHRGDLATARLHLERSVSLAASLDDPAAHVAALNNLALATADEGRVERAIEIQQQAVERGARRGDRHREAALRNNLADLLHLAGRGEEALHALEEAVSLFAGVDDSAPPSPEIWKLVDW